VTQRAQAHEENLAKHKTRALVLVIVCTAITIAYAVFLALMATHMPRVLAEEEATRGPWSAEVDMEWDNLVVDHTSDLELGNLQYEVTRGEANETVVTGSHSRHDDEVIVIELGEGGEYGVYLTPSGVNSGKEYDIQIREFYISPNTIGVLKMVALFVMVFLVPFLWYAFFSAYTAKFREEYRFAWMAILLTIVLSAIIAFAPWV
jgi:hypothetical protein